MEITQVIIFVLMVSTVIQFVVDRIKEILGPVIMAKIPTAFISLIVGILFSCALSINLFTLVGYPSSSDVFSYIVSGLILSAGAAPIHELIETLRGYREVK